MNDQAISKEVCFTLVPEDPFGLVASGQDTGMRTLVVFGNFFQFNTEARRYTSSQDVLDQLAEIPVIMQTDQRAASVLTLQLLADKHRPLLSKSIWFLGIPFFPTNDADVEAVISDVKAAIEGTFGLLEFINFRTIALHDTSGMYIPDVEQETV